MAENRWTRAGLRLSGTVAGGLLLTGPLVSVVRADATVTTVTRVELPKGMGKPGKADRQNAFGMPEGKATVRYKDGAMRTDGPEGGIVMTSERIITIDDRRKIWSSVPLGRAADSTNPLMSMVKMKTRTVVVAGGKTSTLLGKLVRNWLVQSNVVVDVPRVDGLMGNAAPADVKPMSVTMKFKMEFWTTDAVDVGKGVAALGIGRSMPGAPMFKEMTDKIASIPGLPLKVVFTQSFDSKDESGKRVPPVTVVTEAVSLDEATLPVQLFDPPKGYRQVSSDRLGPSVNSGLGFPTNPAKRP